jgi:hypothetical protein
MKPFDGAQGRPFGRLAGSEFPNALEKVRGGFVRSIAIVPGSKKIYLTERQEPIVSAPDEVKLRVLGVGI